MLLTISCSNFSKCFLIILFCCFLYKIEAADTLVNALEYTENVCLKMMENLAKREITGNGLPMRKFSSTINSTRYGLSVIGRTNFHSGFVTKIKTAFLRTNNLVPRVTETEAQIEGEFYFNDVQIYYDVQLDVEGYKDDGHILLDFDSVSFEIQLTYTFATETFVPLVKTPSAPVLHLGRNVHPNNGYFQLVGEQVYDNYYFRLPMIQSFAEWINILQAELTEAATHFKFPDICYTSVCH